MERHPPRSRGRQPCDDRGGGLDRAHHRAVSEWPSGHNCIDGAHVAILRMFFGDAPAGGFQITSASALLLSTEEKVRSFDTFSQPLAELIDARIWAGLHFRSADVQGQALGRNVAAYGVANYFQPVGN